MSTKPTVTDEYTPTTAEVRGAYVRDGYNGEAFDLWLREVRAKAWDEGRDAAVDLAWREGRYVKVASEPSAPNPYREEANR